jgi:hypothetical protein
MIIFGTRSMESVRTTGIFNCPRCGPSKPYRHKSVNRWFTLYFIPVIPMGSIGAYIECAECGANYAEAVLSYDPQAETSELYLKLRGLLVLVAVFDGTPADSDEVRAIGEAYLEATGTPLAVGDIASDLGHAANADISLKAYARGLAERLNFAGKSNFLRAAFHVLCAKGPPRADASTVIGELCGGLQLTTQQMKQILG